MRLQKEKPVPSIRKNSIEKVGIDSDVKSTEIYMIINDLECYSNNMGYYYEAELNPPRKKGTLSFLKKLIRCSKSI